MKSPSLHPWQQNTDSTLGGRWTWFAASPPGGGGGAKTPATAKPDQQEGAESITEAKLEAQRNRRFIEKLDKRVARNEISAQVAEEAKNSFSTQDSQRKTLARMLATEKIDETGYGQVNDALQSSAVNQKALGRLVVRGRIDLPLFQDALADLEVGSTYAKSLAGRLASDRIDAEEFRRARRYADSTDPAEVDQRTWSQQLARGDISPQQFRAHMATLTDMPAARDEHAVEGTRDPVAEVQIEIHHQIMEVLVEVGVVMESLPESEKTQPIQALYSQIHSINKQERSNHAALATTLRPLGLSADQMKQVLEFDAEDSAQLESLRPQLSAMGIPDSEIGQIMTFKTREYDIEKKFIKLMEGARKALEVAKVKIEGQLLERRMLEEWTRSTGITIAPGTKVAYVYPDEVSGNVRSMTIKQVVTDYAPIPDSEGNVIGQSPMGFTLHAEDGRSWSMGRFSKWVNAVDAYEVIESQTDLQGKLGLTEVGMNLKPGQTLEFRSGLRKDEKGHVIPQSGKVKIRDISDNTVRFSEPVETLNPEEAPELNLAAPRMAAEMTTGEFAKWARRHDMIPDITTLGSLKEFLRQYNTYANQKKFPHRKAELYPPLTLEPGEWLQPGDSRGERVQVQAADDSGVTFESGEKLTLPQFFKWVRDNNIERANPDDLTAREAYAGGNVGEAPEEVKKSFFKKFTDAMNSNKKPDPTKPGAPPSTVEPKSVFNFFEKLKPIGPFKELFYEYEYLSVMDLINMGKEIIEFIKRKNTRRSKNRYSTLGKALPGVLGTEFERVQQAAENEEVNQYKEAMSNWGTWQILGKLHNTGSKDEAKACFIVLTEKGELRWDDLKMWNTLNRLTAKFTNQGSKLFIPLTHEAQRDPKDPSRLVSGEDRALESIDVLWGEGGGAEWYSKVVSSYDSNKRGFEHKGRQLEADPKGTGGLEAELNRLLRNWKEGKYVNPIEYEELVDFAIDAGKMSGESKLFYLMEGVSAKCGGGPMEGMTLLHVDRIGAIDSKYLAKFPLLDYFTNKSKKPFHPGYLSGDITLEGSKKGYRQKDYEMLRDANFKDDSEANKAGKGFSRFLWENMLVDEAFQTRLSKGLRTAQNMDHDDAHMFIPPATMEDINTITNSHNGAQKYFTTEGYKNGYPGFNQYIVSLSNRDEMLRDAINSGSLKSNEQVEIYEDQIKKNTDLLMQAVQSYILFDSYIDGRNDADNDRRARIDRSKYDGYAVNDGTLKVGEHQAQLSNMVKKICEAYGIDWKAERIFDRPTPGKINDNKEIGNKIEVFLKSTLPEAIKKDPSKMLDIIKERKYRAKDKIDDPNALTGMKASNRLLEDD